LRTGSERLEDEIADEEGLCEELNSEDLVENILLELLLLTDIAGRLDGFLLGDPVKKNLLKLSSVLLYIFLLLSDLCGNYD